VSLRSHHELYSNLLSINIEIKTLEFQGFQYLYNNLNRVIYTLTNVKALNPWNSNLIIITLVQTLSRDD